MNYNFKLLTLLLILFILSLQGCGDEQTVINNVNTHSPIVQKLILTVKADSTLKEELEKALKEQDETSFWYGKTMEDMYDFFDEWLVFTPAPENTRDYMYNFHEFANSEEGKAIVANEPFREWLYEFMLSRGQFLDSILSTAGLSYWLNDQDVKIEDYIVPAGGFKSFNDFFTREVKPGARPISEINDNSILTSPADSSIMKISDNITSKTEFKVKGDILNVKELLGEEELSDVFTGGKALLCMLSTENYHRFHSPVQGEILSEEQLAGLYYGMTGEWVDYFFEHRRGYFIFETEKFGYVGMVSVGMFTISSIEFIKSEGDMVNKGEELGHFAYGGSAIILLFEPDKVDFSSQLEERPVHFLMGEEIGSSI